MSHVEYSSLAQAEKEIEDHDKRYFPDPPQNAAIFEVVSKKERIVERKTTWREIS